MIIEEEENVIKTDLEGQSKACTIKTTSKAFKILSSNLYKNKILAVIRELSCNAYDAHVMAGKTSTPFELFLPTVLEPTFRIRDHGIGLAPEDVEGLYMTFFDSTKSKSNDFTGALGLGSKSPFSYSTTFTVTSFWNGKKYLFMCFMDPTGIPSVQQVMVDDTDEDNGLQVEIPVVVSDVKSFTSNAREFFKYWQHTLPIINVDLKVPEKILSGDNWSIYRKDNDYSDYYASRKPIAVQGGVAYPIDFNSISTSLGDKISKEDKEFFQKYSSSYIYTFATIFPIGQLDFTPGREDLSYDQVTSKNLLEGLKKSFKAAEAEIAEQFYDETKPFYEIAQHAKKTYEKFAGTGFFSTPRMNALQAKKIDVDLPFIKKMYLRDVVGGRISVISEFKDEVQFQVVSASINSKTGAAKLTSKSWISNSKSDANNNFDANHFIDGCGDLALNLPTKGFQTRDAILDKLYSQYNNRASKPVLKEQWIIEAGLYAHFDINIHEDRFFIIDCEKGKEICAAWILNQKYSSHLKFVYLNTETADEFKARIAKYSPNISVYKSSELPDLRPAKVKKSRVAPKPSLIDYVEYDFTSYVLDSSKIDDIISSRLTSIQIDKEVPTGQNIYYLIFNDGFEKSMRGKSLRSLAYMSVFKKLGISKIYMCSTVRQVKKLESLGATNAFDLIEKAKVEALAATDKDLLLAKVRQNRYSNITDNFLRLLKTSGIKLDDLDNLKSNQNLINALKSQKIGDQKIEAGKENDFLISYSFYASSLLSDEKGEAIDFDIKLKSYIATQFMNHLYYVNASEKKNIIKIIKEINYLESFAG